jgi:hypothetical protein
MNCYRKKLQIPLNPPFPKGDFNTPLEKGGQGGFFIAGGGPRLAQARCMIYECTKGSGLPTGKPEVTPVAAGD